MRMKLDSWCVLPTSMGEFRMYDSGNEHVRVVCFGDIRDQGAEPLLRVHSSCLASEVFGALDCDCADQLREAMKLIAMEGRGLVIHLHQEGRGHGLSLKIEAIHRMQRDGLDTAEAFDALGLEQDIRDYESALQVVKGLNLSSIRLISNNPRKASYFVQNGVQVALVSTNPAIRPENSQYLYTKKVKLGHQLKLDTDNQLNGDIHFYHSDQSWGELSNFSPHSIFILNRVWPTVEHFYQAQKFSGTPHEEAIRRCKTPMLAKLRAEELSDLYCRKDWPAVRERVMKDGILAKFRQHPDLRDRLLGSGSRLLVERTKNDSYWGDGGDGSGLNRLGNILMEVRDELRSELSVRLKSG